MDKSLLKLILLISAFLGVLFGVLTAIPYIGAIAFWLLLCFAAVIETGFLSWLHLLKLYTVKESIVLSGIIGFVSFMVFCLVYIPIIIILNKVFNYSDNYLLAIMLGNANFFIILIFSVFMAILSATINAFSGCIMFYVKEFINNNNNGKD